jgi:hypothetical protein
MDNALDICDSLKFCVFSSFKTALRPISLKATTNIKAKITLKFESY